MISSRVIRIAIVAWAALTIPTPAQTAAPPFSRTGMLQDLSRQVAEGYRELTDASRHLTNSVANLLSQPSAATLEQARQSWRATASAANRLRCFQAGPIAERDDIPTFYYWQIQPKRIEAELRAPGPMRRARLDELGAPLKGLFAMEYLLFDSTVDAATVPGKRPLLEQLAGPSGSQVGAYLSALAGDLESKATILAQDWVAPGSAHPTLAGKGQEGVNLVVNQLAAAIEDVAERHLRLVLVLPHPIERQLYRVEGSRSHTSLEGVLATLEGTRHFFEDSGSLGLKDALQPVNPELVQRVANQFSATLDAVRAIKTPLEDAVLGNRASVQKAYDQTRALEVLVKVDVVSALGVTLTFSSNDGD